MTDIRNLRRSSRAGLEPEAMPNTLTTSEAAELVGLTPKAIKNRLDRGQLQYILKAGRRRIPVAELVRAELLDAEAVGAATEAERASKNGGPHLAPNGPNVVDYSDVIRELVSKVEQQAEALGRLRALTVESESLTSEADQLRAALTESRARVVELEASEAARRRWFRRG